MKIWIPQKNVMAPQTAMFIHKNGGSKLFQTGWIYVLVDCQSQESPEINAIEKNIIILNKPYYFQSLIVFVRIREYK